MAGSRRASGATPLQPAPAQWSRGSPGLVETFLYSVDRQTLAGSFRQCVVDSGSGGGCVSGIAVSKVPCSPAKVPVP
jgi:hypothetical protein